MVGDAPVPGWLATDWLLNQFVKRRTEARRRYRKFVAEGGASVWSGLRQQSYLGDDTFVAKMQKKVPVQTDQLNIPRAQRRGPAPPLEAIAAEHPERTPPLLRLMRLAPTATARLPIISVCTRRRWDGWCAAECYPTRPPARPLDHLARGKHKQRMAAVLGEGGFPGEALAPMREAVDIALQALVIWRGHDAGEPPSLGLIDSSLVQEDLLAPADITLIARMREESSGQDEVRSGELLAQGGAFFARAVSQLESAK